MRRMFRIPPSRAASLSPSSLPFVAPLALASAFVAPGPAGAAAQEIDPARLAGMEARSIGPAATSGRVAAIAGVPGRSTTLYVGSATGGLWKSTDAGMTWEPIFDDQDASSIGAIAVHPANPDLVWVGTGETNLRNSVGVGRGIYRSLDGGESWEKMGLENSEHIHRIVVHPHDPMTAYVAAMGPLWSAGGERGVYRTTDGGESWERVLAGPNPYTGANVVVMDPENPLKLFASLWEARRWPFFFESGGHGSGLWVTHDGGETWREITAEDGLPEGMLGRIGVDVAPSDPDVVYALVEARKTVLLRSDDGGRSFRTVNRAEEMGDRPFYYGDLMVDPKNPDRVFQIAGTLRLSTDGGRTFRGAATWPGGVHVDHHALWIDPEDPDFVVDGNDGGVYVSRDGTGSWRFVQNLPLSQYYEVDVDMALPYHVYGGLQDNGSWRGPSEVWEQGGIRNHHWVEIGFGDGFGALDDPEEPRYGYSMSQRGFLRRWDLETGQRKDVRPAPPSDSVPLRFNWNAPIALDPFRPNTVYFGSQFLHRSPDDGLTWEIVSPDLTTNNPEWQRQEISGGLTVDATGAENHTNLYTIAPSPVERGVIWTGSDDGKVHLTRDDAATWTDLTDRIPDRVPENAWVSHIEASKFEGGTAFVVFHAYTRGDWGTYVYRVEDYGRRWTSIADAEVDGFARVLEQDEREPGLLFLGTEFGLWVTLDGGGRWYRWTHGVPTVPVRDLVVHPREADLVVATHGRGIHILDDIRPLRELARDPSALSRLHLFEVPPAYEHVVASPRVFRFDGSTMFSGENPPYGARISFAAVVPGESEEEPSAGRPAVAEPGGPPRKEPRGEEPRGEEPRGEEPPKATLEVLHADSVIRSEEIEVEDGLNRVTWNLRREGFRRPEGRGGGPGGGGGEDEEEPRIPGPEVLPGEYTLRLVFQGDTVTGPVEVRLDPRLGVPEAGLRAKYEAHLRVGRHYETATEAVERIRETRTAVEEAMALAGRREVERLDSLKAVGRRAVEALDGAEGAFTGPLEEEQGIVREEENVFARLGGVRASLSSSYDAPTEAQRTYLRLAEKTLREAVERANRVLTEGLASFRGLLEEAGLELLPAPEPLPAAPEPPPPPGAGGASAAAGAAGAS